MGGHLDNDRMRAYSRGTLPPDEVLAADDHLAACDACRERAANAVGLGVEMGSLLRAMVTHEEPASVHLTYEQLEARARGRLGGPERWPVEAHLRECGSCAAEAGDLAEFIQRDDRVRRAPRRTFSPAFVFALAAALVAAVGVAWLVPASLRRQNRELTARAAELRNELERLRAEVPAAAARPVLTLNDRTGMIGLSESGELTGLDALSIAEGRAIAAALRTGRAEVPAAVRDLVGSTGVLLGDAEAETGFEPIAPVGTAVRTDRPTFSWRPLRGPATYTVAVYDSRFNLVARSESLAGASWTPSRPLLPGAIHVWQVTAHQAGKELSAPAPPAPEARFKVLDRSESASLDRALESAAGSHLAAGVLLARAGCLDEARDELQALLRDNPDSVVARDLLQSVVSAGRDSPDGAVTGGR